MLVTIIEKRYGHWMPIREYYQFSLRHLTVMPPTTSGTKERARCPGCNHNLTVVAMATHECHGGTEQYPRLDPRRYQANQRWNPRKKRQDYTRFA